MSEPTPDSGGGSSPPPPAALLAWRSVSAVVALVLIVVAFVAGWSLRGGEPRTVWPNQWPYVSAGMPDDTAAEDAETERELVMTPAAVKLAEIRTTRVSRRFPTRTVRMSGQIQYDQTRVATIPAHLPGRVERLFVDYAGVRVNAGDHVASIYSPDLIQARADLLRARTALELDDTTQKPSEQDLAAARATLAAVRERFHGWGFSDAEIDELAVSNDPFDQVPIHSPIGGVVVEKNASEGMYVRTGDPLCTLADLERLWVLIDAYESHLPWLRYGQDVTFTTESLPGEILRGRISFIDPVVTPATQTVRVRIDYDNLAGRLKPGMFVRATAHARIAGAGVVIGDSLAGKWISPVHPEIVRDGPGTCEVSGQSLVPAEDLGYVSVTEDLDPPLVIPASAPLITGHRAVVYVRVEGRSRPTFEGREVILGPRAGDEYVVLSGLEEGDDVVVNGAFKIDSAMQIAARPSMMFPSAPALTPALASASASASSRAPSPATPHIPPEFLAGLAPVYDAYFDAQEALARDDLPGFGQGILTMRSMLGVIDDRRLPATEREAWNQAVEILMIRSENADRIRSIDLARELFEMFSRSLIEIDQRFGHAGTQTHYVVFCPMAFDTVGATWLARTDQVNNPYFGSAMLTSGMIRSQIQPVRQDGRQDPRRETP